MEPENIPIGVVGLGLMGCSIATCLLMAGHPVVAIAPIESDLEHAGKRIREHLVKSRQEGLTPHDPATIEKKLFITADYNNLA
ncbi:MAG: 3-hydroxyacyl-CoA dehydrogenase NAD-binding domain-containing protein, partial [Cyclobacteriaceae bacterium]